MGRADIKCIYIEPSTTEEAGYSSQNAELIFDENGDDMTHGIEIKGMVDDTGLEPVTYWV